MSGSRGVRRWTGVPGALLVSAIFLVSAACSGAPPAPSASAAVDRPVVVIQQPADGALLALGQNVVVSGAASDTVGVDHVTLLADGVSVASTPSGAPATLVPFALNWLAGPGGGHTLQVIAYRADGMASDPVAVQVAVGPTGSGVPVASFITFAPFPSLPVSSAPAPKRTKKPKGSQQPTIAPTATPPPLPTAGTPTDTPPTTPPTMPPTIDPTGTAPDDTASEPYQIVLVGSNDACPPGPPASAVGCLTEQVSAPGGDTADQLFFVPAANTSYMIKMTSCTDQSDTTIWRIPGQNTTLITGCGDWLVLTYGAPPAATSNIEVTFGAAGGQTNNLYQYTVYQCAFANCGNQ